MLILCEIFDGNLIQGGVNMRVEKVAKDPIEIEIKDITLLSEEEYEKVRDIIPACNIKWWLKSLNNPQDAYVVVDKDARKATHRELLYGCFGVRPVLVCTLPNTELKIGDKVVIPKFKWKKISEENIVGEQCLHRWTVISDDRIICDEYIGRCRFELGFDEYEGDEYNESYIKSWLKDWLDDQKSN